MPIPITPPQMSFRLMANHTPLEVTVAQCQPNQLVVDAVITVAPGTSMESKKTQDGFHYHVGYPRSDLRRCGGGSYLEQAITPLARSLSEAASMGVRTIGVDLEASFDLAELEKQRRAAEPDMAAIQDDYEKGERLRGLETMLRGILVFVGSTRETNSPSIENIIIAVGPKTFPLFGERADRFSALLTIDLAEQGRLEERAMKLRGILYRLDRFISAANDLPEGYQLDPRTLQEIVNKIAAVEAEISRVTTELERLG